MNLKTIAQIFELYARNLTGTRTVLQTLSALAAKLSEDKEFPPRKIIEYFFQNNFLSYSAIYHL